MDEYPTPESETSFSSASAFETVSMSSILSFAFSSGIFDSDGRAESDFPSVFFGPLSPLA